MFYGRFCELKNGNELKLHSAIAEIHQHPVFDH